MVRVFNAWRHGETPSAPVPVRPERRREPAAITADDIADLETAYLPERRLADALAAGGRR